MCVTYKFKNIMCRLVVVIYHQTFLNSTLVLTKFSTALCSLHTTFHKCMHLMLNHGEKYEITSVFSLTVVFTV